jgi:hypothetical protein
MKHCNGCKQNHPYSFFRKRTASKDGLNNLCKTCHSAKVKKWKDANPEKVKATREKYKKTGQRKYRYLHYGISHEQYLKMLSNQHGGCAICGATDRKLVIDHCHETGVVRGILCHNCNAGIGMLGDNLPTIKAAVWYLEFASDETP